MADHPNRSSHAGSTVAWASLPAAVVSVLGFIITRSDAAQLSVQAAAAAHRAGQLVLVFALVGVAASAAILWLRLQSSTRIRSSDHFAAALLQGDSDRAIREAREVWGLGDDALNVLADALNPSGAELGKPPQDAPELDEFRHHLDSVSSSMQRHMESVLQLDRAVHDGLGAQHVIGDNVEGLSRSAESTSSSILQMVAINNEVTENIASLSISVQETTTAIEEMTFSVKEVARNIEELSAAAEETAASMNQMDVSISQVETNANETSKLSETVSNDAATGVNSINKPIQGIDKIKDSSRVAAEVIGSLGQKIDEIGNILTVIDDVAEQTNLLALNAAIIAAQAGEHGRGFAVVADEIKALAERTGSSTKEIAELIKTVQNASRNAIAVMSQGVENVEEGVRLGHNAEDALRKIVDSAKRSTLMIKAIAQATVEQAKGSKQVTNAISRIAETVQQIALATAEQAKGAEQIMKSSDSMKIITSRVERSTEEQNRGGRQMTESIDNIREMVEGISEAQRRNQESHDRVAMAYDRADSAGQRSVAALQELQSVFERWSA